MKQAPIGILALHVKLFLVATSSRDGLGALEWGSVGGAAADNRRDETRRDEQGAMLAVTVRVGMVEHMQGEHGDYLPSDQVQRELAVVRTTTQ